MDIKEEHICRLCLKVANNEFKVDEIMKQMFEILLLDVDFNITRDPIICQDCMEVAKKCLNFKWICVHTEQTILSYSANRKEAKHNINVIYEPREHIRAVLEDFRICRFCMTEFETNNFVPLSALRSESMFEMLSPFMAEITDFNAIENPLICTKCRESLKGYFKFVLNCLESEEKLKAYCKKKGTDSMGQVKLGNVLQFIFIDILEYPDKYSQSCKIEQDHLGYVNPETYIEFIKQEELGIKDEKPILKKNSYENASEINLDKYGNIFPLKEYDEGIKFDVIYLKTENENSQANITEDNEVEDVMSEISNMGINKGTVSTDGTKRRKNVNRDMARNNDRTEAHILEHNYCLSKVEQHHVLKSSIGHCKRTSEPKRKKNVNRHMITQNNSVGSRSYITAHRQVSKIKMHKCSLCPHETTKRYRLAEHMLVHMHSSEIKMHKCSLCPFESKYRSNLKNHMVRHNNVSEVKMRKCSLCAYEGRQKSQLTSHMLLHKDVSEIKMHKCSLCAYESKRKGNLISHMMVHNDVSEIKMQKCLLCPFESKLKKSLRRHMLIHKAVSEIKMYKCSLCTYESKQKSDLNKHMLIHKDVSDIKMHQCLLCPFESKHKKSLQGHMLVHKNVSEMKMHKCSLCPYKTKRKYDLTKHMVVHKNVSEIRMYKCSLCPYEGKQKTDLKKHILIHKNL